MMSDIKYDINPKSRIIPCETGTEDEISDQLSTVIDLHKNQEKRKAGRDSTRDIKSRQ